jgi:hypothetical protein
MSGMLGNSKAHAHARNSGIVIDKIDCKPTSGDSLKSFPTEIDI